MLANPNITKLYKKNEITMEVFLPTTSANTPVGTSNKLDEISFTAVKIPICLKSKNLR